MYKLLIFLVILKLASGLDTLVTAGIRYYFYHGLTHTTYDVNTIKNIVNNPNFNQNKPTTFYIYGTMESIIFPTVVTVKNAYLLNGKHNFIIVGNINPLFHVFNNAPTIAENFSNNMIQLLNAGLDISKVTFVGFSLGAKAIAPLTSRLIKTKSQNQYTIPRIVGLDPGIVENSELYLVNGQKLNANDAQFVMTVRTDCNNWGSKDPHGHVNFWVNGGCNQAICLADFQRSLCNHLMAPKYWAEAVRTDRSTAFESRQCGSYTQYLSGFCNTAPVAYIGLYTPNTLTGNYYLQTGIMPPYSKS